MGEKVSHPAAFHALGGGVRSELRNATNKGLGGFFGNFDEGNNHLRRVLTVGIHHKRVSEALLVGEAKGVEDSGPLA